MSGGRQLAESHSFGLVFDDRFLLHDTGMVHARLPDGTSLDAVEHPSSARIIHRIHKLLVGSGLAARFSPIAARSATVDELSAFHTRPYISKVEALSAEGSGEAGEGAPVSAGSYQAALLAAGGTIAAMDAILDGTVGGAYVLARPPGHHAIADMGMGYCLFNNVAVATLHARSRGLDRLMIVDWDVHHGNGTQAAFYSDPSVLFLSVHQEDWYPIGMGTLDQQGDGDAVGSTVNVPLPAGTGDRGYVEVFERIVGPAARKFKPQLLLVSAGQDASMYDPLGRMLVSMEGFRSMGAYMQGLADEICDGKLLLVQEGGYSEAYTPFCTLGALAGVTGIDVQVADPYMSTSEIVRAQTVYSHDTAQAIKDAVHAHGQQL
jgi:acetoin utilization deacetylase AcuC-like enzyme